MKRRHKNYREYLISFSISEKARGAYGICNGVFGVRGRMNEIQLRKIEKQAEKDMNGEIVILSICEI